MECEAEWGWPWQSTSVRAEMAARSILFPAQPDGKHPNLFPAFSYRAAQQSWASQLCHAVLENNKQLPCWLLLTLGHDLASSGSALRTANGKAGKKTTLNQIRGVIKGSFRLFNSATIPSAMGKVLLPPPLTPSPAPLSV